MTGAELKELRKKLQFTQAEMARRSHLTEGYYRKLEIYNYRILPQYIMVFERISLARAVELKNIDLAMPSIRQDVMALLWPNQLEMGGYISTGK